MKKGLIIAAVVLIALGILVFAGGFIASGFNFAKLDVAKYETNTYNVDSAFNGIEVNTIDADVTLKPSEDGQFRAVCVERNGKNFEVRVENGALKVTEPKRDNWPMRMFNFKSQSVTLYLPQEHYEALSVKTVTGDVKLDSLGFGEAVISVTTGDVDAKNVNVEGAVSVTVTTGDIKFSGVACKTFKTTGSTGDVELTDTVAADSFDIQRSTGDVVFRNSDAGEITVKTTTGDVSGTLRTGKIFTAKSTTGDVRIPDSASGGKCDISTKTGDINIEVRH
ncbi:MAG: DUF4097 family beta strand repeat protein [Clostridia bacterium]|nr:DUF4097 family beta strand repeat protein [Clostridia bacterium]